MRRSTRQLSLKDCYEVLRLEKGADLQAVKRAYRRRAFELHPDLNPGNPEASRQFQLLNEAYVALSALLKPAEEAREAQARQQESRKDENRGGTDAGTGQRQAEGATDAHATQNDARNSTQAGTAGSGRPESGTSGGTSASAPGSAAGGAQSGAAGQDRRTAGAQQAYAEQDVLRDLLNDPFARRVFEDIYSELNRQQADRQREEPRPAGGQQRPRPEPTRPRAETPGKNAGVHKNTTLHQGNIAWGTDNWNRDFSKGITGVVKDWLRRQIDDEQSLHLPAARLAPGRRIRLQIRRGISDERHTVEVTLPPDFVVGKPVRLRGLGKRVGPWQGDLYLTIYDSDG